MKVVQRNEKGESCIAIAKSLGVGKTQIQYIVRDKEAIKARWEAGENRSRKTTKLRQSTHVSIDEQVWDWFVDARRRNIPVTGKLIQEKALLISMKEQLEDFQASDGWLRRWKDRHNVHLSCLSGERADISEETVNDWKKRLPHLCEGYQAENIFNADETGLYYRALPSRSMVHVFRYCIFLCVC